MADKTGRDRNAFMFLGDIVTESECLRLRLLGTTQANARWALKIKEGDNLYLFNFDIGTVQGPFLALSSADCYDPNAWGGNFPVQVRMQSTAFTRRSYIQRPNVPDVPVCLRRRRKSGDITNDASELFSWLQQVGEPTE